MLFKSVKYWDLEIKNLKKGNSTIKITSTFYPFLTRRKSDMIMTLSPAKESGYYPVTIRTGKNCAVSIGIDDPEMDYYLNISNNSFEIISDIAPYVEMQNKKCNYCVKRTKLKALKQH